MPYQVPQHIDPNKVFLVNLSELEGRFDPKMSLYNKRTQEFAYPKVKLKTLLLSKPQYGANEPGILRTQKEQARYIRITDIDENGLISNKELGATVESFDEKYILHENDIVFARSGATAGKTYIHKNLPYECIFAGYLIRFVVNPQIVLPDYVFIFTQLNIYKEWVNAIQRPSAQPNINAEEYQALEIPLPDLCKQNEIVEYIHNAYAQKRQKEQQAEALLQSIDDYLLGELGIQLPEMKSPTLQDRMFVVNFSEANGERLDPMFYTSQFSNIVAKLHDSTECKRLGQIVHFSTEIWNQKDYYEKEFPYIEIGAINIPHGKIEDVSFIPVEQAPSRARVIVRTGDIIISTTRPDRGAIIKITENENLYIASTGFSVIRNVDNNINPDYLLAILRHRLILMQMRQRSTGGNYPAITQEELSKIIIPILPLSKQQEIVDHISAIRKQAKALQEEGKAILEQAKKEVEQMILGN